MRIYIAGPEVFLKQAPEVLRAKKEMCRLFGFEGVVPFDAQVENVQNDVDSGIRICQANERLIDGCDVVIANVTPFRGQNVDVGTAVEIGYARARGKRILAYTNTTDSHAQRLVKNMFFEHTKRDGPLVRETFWGSSIDDFDMVDNLMVDGSIFGSGGQIFRVDGEQPEWVNQLVDLRGFQMCLVEIPKNGG